MFIILSHYLAATPAANALPDCTAVEEADKGNRDIERNE